jgi:hypothetical protein
MLVGTRQAATLLGICPQRIRQLLLERRVKGAQKVGRIWSIPLFKGMPKIIPGTRGPAGRWARRPQKRVTRIHINRQKLSRNRKYKENNPVLVVDRGKKRQYCHQLEIIGPCRLVYQPDRPLACGATLWIEVEPHIDVILDYSSASFCRKPQSAIA